MESKSEKWKIKNILPDAGIFAVFLFTMVFNLTHSSLWGDEWIEYTYSRGSLLNGDLFRNVASTFQPPLYNVVMHFWLMINDGVLWFRMFNVIVAFISGIILFRTSLKLFNKLTARITVLMLSASFIWVYYVQECSEYTMMIFFLVCAMYFYVQCFDRFSYKRMYGFILSVVGAVYSQYGSVFVVVPLAVLFFAGNFISEKISKDQKRIMGASYIGALLFFALPLYLVFVRTQLAHNEIGKHSVNPGLEFLNDMFIVPGGLLGYFYGIKTTGVLIIPAIIITIFSLFISVLVIKRVKADWIKASLLIAMWSCFILHFVLVKLHLYAMVNPTLSAGFYDRYSFFYIPLLALCLPVIIGKFRNIIPPKFSKVFTIVLIVFALVLCTFSVRKIIPNWTKAKDKEFAQIWMENKGWEDTTYLFGTAEYGFKYYVSHFEGYEEGYLAGATKECDLKNLPDRFWLWRTNWDGDGWQEVLEVASSNGYNVKVYEDSGSEGQLAFCSKQ